MKLLTPIALSAAVVLSLLAGASGVPGRGVAEPAKAGGSCFWARNVENFASVDDRTVNLRVGSRDIYQLKLFAPCIDVDWAQHIGLRSRGSDFICEGANVDAEILSPSPIGHQRCQVTSVHKLSADEVAALPKRAQP
ncbi:MAG: DUF6491 family protein [Caulobacterales bacterium]